MPEGKTVSDPVHGTVRLDGVVLDLTETLELQRLNSIRQLGLTYLVFPGANHSRIEHCLGVAHVAGRMADALGLVPEERDLVVAAGLLHDVGHGPFSHTLEHVLSAELAIDHMDLTQRIILGEDDNVDPEERAAFPDARRIPEVLEAHGLAPREVARLIRGLGHPVGPTLFDPARPAPERRYLFQLIHGALDADQIDFLMRDGHYTGVALGMVDFPRILQTVARWEDDLVVDRKGLPALEGVLVARALMYSSVYFHKTVRIAEQMVARAVERSKASMAGLQKLVDHELLEWLMERGGWQREVALRIKYRKLYKRAWVRGKDDLDDDERATLARLTDPVRRRRAEDAIARRAGAKPGQVLLDIPLPELLISEPRIARTDVPVLDDGRLRAFEALSPLGRALRARDVSEWVVMVACDPDHRAAVAKAVDRVLFA